MSIGTVLLKYNKATIIICCTKWSQQCASCNFTLQWHGPTWLWWLFTN